MLKLKTENNPKNAAYLLQLAAHYYVLNRKNEMDAVIQRLTDEKQYPEGHLLAGDFFFFRLRRFEEAENQYQAAIKAFPKEKAALSEAFGGIVRHHGEEERGQRASGRASEK